MYVELECHELLLGQWWLSLCHDLEQPLYESWWLELQCLLKCDYDLEQLLSLSSWLCRELDFVWCLYVIWIGDVLLGFPKEVYCVDNPLWCDHTHYIQNTQCWGNSSLCDHIPGTGNILSSSFDIPLTVDGRVMVAVRCCTALNFSTSDIVLLRIYGPFSYLQVAMLQTFFKPLLNILIEAASLVKLQLLASVLNQCTCTARDSFPCCWIALQSFSLNRSFISSHDLFEEITSVASVHVKPYYFTLASLALLSLVRSAAISMLMSQSSNLVKSCSLKTGISCTYVLGMTSNCIWQWRAWTGLEDQMRLPQTTVTSRWPLAKAQNPLIPPPWNGELSGRRLVDVRAGINQQTGCLDEITHCLAEIWCNWANSRGK